LEQVHALELYAKTASAVKVRAPDNGTPGDADQAEDILTGQLGELRVGQLTNVPLPKPTGKVTWKLSDKEAISDLLLLINWGRQAQE
jgi:hypothetical protein